MWTSGTRVVVGNWLSAGANKWSNISFNTKPKRLSGGNRLVLIWIILFTVPFHGSIMPLFGISSRHRTFCNRETVSTVCKLWYYRAVQLYSTVVRVAPPSHRPCSTENLLLSAEERCIQIQTPITSIPFLVTSNLCYNQI